MIIVKSQQEIGMMAVGGKILAEVLDKLAKEVRPGITTLELNQIAEELILEKGAAPAFRGYQGFPAALCTSINEDVVHGVPSDRKLIEGDIVGLDLGVIYPSESCFSCPFSKESCGGQPGLFTDAAITVAVGQVNEEAEKLIKAAKRALYVGLGEIKAGAFLGDIGYAIQKYAESEGFSVIRDLVGHGVGKEIHEDPEIPNYGQRHTGVRLQEGMTLAIEPMLAAGRPAIKKGDDGFAYRTTDRSLASHFEHTVAVTKRGHKVLTE